MSLSKAQLIEQQQDLIRRLGEADHAHKMAKQILSRFEGDRGTAHYERLKDDVDRTLIHLKVLTVAGHQLQIEALQLSIKEVQCGQA